MPSSELSIEEVNTKEEIRRGEDFAQWMRAGLARKGWKIVELAAATGLSDSYLGVLANRNGIKTSTKRYQRPSEKNIALIARELGNNVNDGRRTAGYIDNSKNVPAPVSTQEPPKLYKYELGEIGGQPAYFGSFKEMSEAELDRLKRGIRLVLGE